MSRMNSSDRARAARVLDAEQKARFERAATDWSNSVCEVQVAKTHEDSEFLEEAWTRGECKGALVIDHRDNNNDHNPEDGSNYQWLCRSHNVKKNPPKVARRTNRFLNGNGLEQSLNRNSNRVTETVGPHEWQLERERMMPATMRKNIEYVPVFRRSVKLLISRYGRMKRKDLLDAACEKAGCAQSTGANYLDKLCSVNGEYMYEKDKETGELWVKRRDS